MVTGDCFYVSEDPRSCIVEQRVDFAEFALDAREGIFDGRKIADVAAPATTATRFFSFCISNSSLSTSAPATSKETRRSYSTPPPAG